MDNETRSRAKGSGSARRQFFADTARMACGIGLLGLGLGLYARHATALPPAAIRPPGALPESEFSGACIRCGMCVRDCPYDILHLAKPEEPMSTGTPYFVARQLPCEMCEDIPCVKACPTGALDHALTDINKAKMGLAVLIDHETCLNFLGLRCDICYRVCPVIDKAITLDPQNNARTGKHTRQVRESLPHRDRRDQGRTAVHRQGPAEFALPAGLGREGKGWRQSGRTGYRAPLQPARGHEV
jgi:ferredoxin-type protein NapG